MPHSNSAARAEPQGSDATKPLLGEHVVPTREPSRHDTHRNVGVGARDAADGWILLVCLVGLMALLLAAAMVLLAL
jgi:hypothetical protein